MNTIKNNIEMKDFLGAKIFSEKISFLCNGDYPKNDELKFHNDWNWLMQVVEKIESIVFDEDNSYNVTIGATNYCVIQDSNGEIYDEHTSNGETKLLTVYNACSKFIKWYNQQNS